MPSHPCTAEDKTGGALPGYDQTNKGRLLIYNLFLFNEEIKPEGGKA